MIRYVSTRGAAPTLDFAGALLAGLARDGGLYVPEVVPRLAETWVDAPSRGYAATALDVMWPFVEGGALGRDRFDELVADAYASFDDPAVVPIRRLDGLGPHLHLAELFHGPTLAFKDIALQLVGRLFDEELGRRGERVTIVGATSGDTGSAAIEALADRAAVQVVILHPHGRVSEVQRRQMTTVAAANVHNVAVEGTFDDCQDLVKALFNDTAFRDRHRLSAVNSINWARVMAQIVYYVTAAAAVGAGRGAPVRVVVPTGNFGNVYAGHIARRMGLPLAGLLIASNRNDILTRFFTTGTMRIEGVEPSLSPSMDIQVSSNLERLLWETLGRDGDAVERFMSGFRERGVVELDEGRLRELRAGFAASRVDDTQTLATMREVHERCGILIDPHTAVGLASVSGSRGAPGGTTAADGDGAVETVVLATAHPAKFPDAVEAATGVRPPLPARLADLFEREERLVVVPNDVDAVRALVAAVGA